MLDIQIWHAAAATETAGELESVCRKWLTGEEHERAARFRKPTSQNQFVVGRGMARQLLGDRLGIDPLAVCFRFSDHGKPHLASSPAIEFNLAHTSGLVIFALGTDQPLGVDVESLDRRVDTELANRYFAAREVQWLLAQPKSQQSAAFLRIWTLKESFIKAVGAGLTMPLDCFAFENIDSQHPQLTFEHTHPQQESEWGLAVNWKSFVFQPTTGYIAAVTINSPSRPVVQTRAFEGFEGFEGME